MLMWLTVTSTILMMSILPIDSFQSPCSGVKNGVLTLKGEEVGQLEAYCDCSLERLELKKALFIDFPACFENREVSSLSVENIDLAGFPRGILKLRDLQELSFKNTGLSFLPKGIARLRSLRTLDLRGTDINALPEGLDHLEKIDLRLTEINKSDQEAIRAQYPQTKIFFSSPCNCN